MTGLRAEFDAVLVAAQAGAGWAFERLWAAYAPAVTGYARLQGAADAEGLANEVFFGAFRTITGFSGDEERFRAWLFTVAHRRIIDERRWTGRRPRTDGADPAVLAERVAVPSAEDDALRRAGVERVRALCACLAPDQEDVLLLRMVGGLTIEEVAAAVGKSPGAVKALQRRGIATLRRMFEREGVPL